MRNEDSKNSTIRVPRSAFNLSGPVPLPFERMVMGLTLLAAVALSLIRIDTTDTPWHLATARLAFQTGHWPTRNTFSYTHPDYSLYQQYPIYQTLLHLVHRACGWEGLSILHCLLWLSIFAFWVRWGGPWKQACILHLPWMLCLWGLGRRMILRPDVLTILLFLFLLHLFDSYRRGRRWVPVLFVLVQLLMANSHQLFVMGLATQGIFLIHLVMVRFGGGRWGISSEDRELAIWPLALALFGSVIACFATPLGLKISGVPSHTIGSLSHHHEQVQEFARFYQDSLVLILVSCATVLAVAGFWQARRRWHPYEVGLWLMGATMVGMALRGVVFFVPISVGIFARCLGRGWNAESSNADCGMRIAESLDSSPFRNPQSAIRNPHSAWFLLRLTMVGITLALCLIIFQNRWISPPRALGGIQPGLGRTKGDWPDSAIRFLKEHPPPGRMMNLSWYAGNTLIFGLYPDKKIFVDPRFEAFPREFLDKASQAESDEEVLLELMDEFEPNWFVAETRLPRLRKQVRGLLASGQWALVHADTIFLVLVRDDPANADYLAAHRLNPQDIDPPDLFEGKGEEDLLGQQLVRMAGLFWDLGLADRAEEMLVRATLLAERHPGVAEVLEELRTSMTNDLGK